MFEAIRSRLVCAWRDLRERGLVTLFFFELIVITLGVLLAQGLADWAGEREADRAMEEVRSHAYLQIGEAAQDTLHWDELRPCFESRISELMRAAASGESVESQTLRRPGIGVMQDLQIDDLTLQRIANRHGREEAESLRSAALQIGRFGRRQFEIAEAWKAFARIDPSHGPVSPGDRDAARDAAATILSHLRGLEISGNLLRLHARALNVEFRVDPSGRYARNCEEMWSKGSTFFNYGSQGTR